jgi:hypothetical protein
MFGRTVIAAEATGFPALLMIIGMLGVLVAIGIAIGGRRSRALRLAGLSALLFVIGLVMANLDDDGSSTPRSLTPRVTSGRADLESYLLTAEDVGDVPTLAGATASDLSGVDLFENPDPRGPCGARADGPPMAGAAGRAFNREGSRSCRWSWRARQRSRPSSRTSPTFASRVARTTRR